MTAFLVSAATGTFPCVGHQITMAADPPTSADATVAVLAAQAGLRRCDLIAHGQIGDDPVGYAYDPAAAQLLPDSARLEPRTPTDLIASLATGDVLTFTGVPPGSGRRLGIDRDRDGCLDGDERIQQTDPASPGVAEPDWDGDGLPDGADLCPGWPQRDHSQHDANGDGLPDECQCGDVDGDGSVGRRDVFVLWRYLAEPTAYPRIALEKCNVAGAPGNDPSLCTWSDLIALSRAVSGCRSPGDLPALAPLCLPDSPSMSPVSATCVDEPL
jgi:hypothetical protein